MKKVILVLVSMSFVFPCFGKEQPQKGTQAKCTIDGYDCLQVAKALDNPQELEAMGLSATHKENSRSYTLSNNISIALIKRNGKVRINLYEANQGQEKPHLRIPPCTMNGYDCKEVIEAIDNPKKLKSMDLKVTKKEYSQGFPTYILSNKATFIKDFRTLSFPENPNKESFFFNAALEVRKYAFSVGQDAIPFISAEQDSEQSVCQINGHDCWEVVKVVENTNKTVLQEWGITVTKTQTFRDGGSITYTLNDGTSIHVNNKMDLPLSQRGEVTILKNGTRFYYNNRGQRIRK